MAAAADQEASATIVEFLQAATEVYKVMMHVRQHPGPSGTMMENLLPRLVNATNALLVPAADTPDGGFVLADACRKVGLDLSLKLHRFHDALHVHGGDSSTRSLWSSQDIDALAIRLHDLAVRHADNADLTTCIKVLEGHRAGSEPGPGPGLLCDFILENLAYKSMHDREDEVVQAHHATFEWIFSNDIVGRDEAESHGPIHGMACIR
ncbi:hypothetical protein RJ55_03818 [Drechmeria coniospora]|nr:hypothetical protein RJ55_03818 [Drechmeria coniospora]